MLDAILDVMPCLNLMLLYIICLFQWNFVYLEQLGWTLTWPLHWSWDNRYRQGLKMPPQKSAYTHDQTNSCNPKLTAPRAIGDLLVVVEEALDPEDAVASNWRGKQESVCFTQILEIPNSLYILQLQTPAPMLVWYGGRGLPTAACAGSPAWYLNLTV